MLFKALFMIQEQQTLDDLHHIKRMMERSSRFITLSGFSGIAAGVCALAGAWFAHNKLISRANGNYTIGGLINLGGVKLLNDLLWIGVITFISAFISAFFFTYLRSKKDQLPMWGAASIRLFWNTTLPLIVGAIFIVRLMQYEMYELVAPSCLIFYGLALVNGSKYTLGEIRYLGFGQLLLGFINLWCIGYGLLFWALGFGILHIIYGILMWYKYERNG